MLSICVCFLCKFGLCPHKWHVLGVAFSGTVGVYWSRAIQICVRDCVASCLSCCVRFSVFTLMHRTHTHSSNTHIHTHSTLMKWKDLRRNRWHHYQCNYVTEFEFPHPYRWIQPDPPTICFRVLENVTAQEQNCHQLPPILPLSFKSVQTQAKMDESCSFDVFLCIFYTQLTLFKVSSQLGGKKEKKLCFKDFFFPVWCLWPHEYWLSQYCSYLI